MSEIKTTKKMTPRELVEEYDRVSKELSSLDKYRTSLQKKLTEYMTTKGLDQLEGEDHKVRLYQTSRDIITKSSVPPEIWTQYSTTITYPRLYVSQVHR